MEPEVSLPHSQVSATCPYTELALSSPYPHIPFHEDPSYYYPPIYDWFSQVTSYLQLFLLKPCVHLSSTPYALHAPPIPFFSILSPEQYLVTGRDHQALHYVVFIHSPVTSSLLSPNILLSTLFSHTLCPRSALSVTDLVSRP
jgi:hypothetical protein